jgi:hypothetical protein
MIGSTWRCTPNYSADGHATQRWLYNEANVFERIVNIKWKFWHGQHKAGLERLQLLAI